MAGGLKDQVREGLVELPKGELRGFERDTLISKEQKRWTEEKKEREREKRRKANAARAEVKAAQEAFAVLKDKLRKEGKLQNG